MNMHTTVLIADIQRETFFAQSHGKDELSEKWACADRARHVQNLNNDLPRDSEDRINLF